MSRCIIQIGQDAFIFSALSFHSSTQEYKPLSSKPLSCTRCGEIFLDALSAIGVTYPKNFGLHSMPSGGASHLANKGVSEELIMPQGRWKTTSAKKNRYVKREIDQMLNVSATLTKD